MVYQYFNEYSEYEVVSFAVDEEYRKSDEFCGLPLITTEECLKKYPPSDYEVFVAIGYRDMNRIKEEKIKLFQSKGYELATYMDPSCRVHSSSHIGKNCFIMEQVAIQPNVIIEDGVYVGSCACIAHDTIIGKYCFMAIGSVTAGNVVVGRNSFVGANATIRNSVNVAEFTLVGAGTYISRDTTMYGVYKHASHCVNILEHSDNAELEQRQIMKRV